MYSGPEYPNLGEKVAKLRRQVIARGGIAALRLDFQNGGRDLVVAYGNAVSAAIRSKQKSELARVTQSHSVNCASGTTLNGENRGEIGRAVAAQQRARTLAWPSQIRRARTSFEWREMYKAAMKEKRKRAKSF